MTTERPLEIEHLPPALHSLFDGLVPLVGRGTIAEKEVNFLSRSLAAYAVLKLAGCSAADAANSLVDGGNDGGIDAVYYAPASNTLWCVQSKFDQSGRGEPSLGDVSKFADGMTALLSGEFSEFEQNPAWHQKLPSIRHHFDSGGLLVRAVLVYSGIAVPAEDRRALFRRLEERYSPDDEYFRFTHFNLTSVHDWVVQADESRVVAQVDLCLKKPGWVRDPYEMIYGLIPLSELRILAQQHGERLVASNIRRYKGRTEVNREIGNTAANAPADFVYLNNGLTAFCERLDINNLDRGNFEQKRVRAIGFSIVNGAQTLGAITAEGLANTTMDGFVFLRVISMERCADDREFAEKITRCTNTQNRILAQDYVALEEEQERIANQLRPSGITYHFRESEDTVPQDLENFSIKEATTAAACLVQDAAGDIQSRILGNRKSLWDTVAQEGATVSRYGQVFRSTLTARVLWRAVQAQRIALEKFRELARAEPNRRQFFESARWLILNLVFLRLHPEQGEELNLNDGQLAQVGQTATDIAESVWAACRALGYATEDVHGRIQYPRGLKSVFCHREDVRRTRNEALRIINQPPVGNLPDATASDTP